MTDLEIEAFLTVSECGSLTEAAKRLFVSQPALSRRLHTLETEIGYSLMERGKGKRNVLLTEQGRAFVGIAHKWQQLWKETRQAGLLDNKNVFRVCGVASLLSFLTPFFQHFLEESAACRLNVRCVHSYEAYSSIENGLFDLALVTDYSYSQNVEVSPLYSEQMCVVADRALNLGETVAIEELDPAREISTPWSNEFDAWHDYWFGTTSIPQIQLDQMLMVQHITFTGGTWAFLPITIARKMTEFNRSFSIHTCEHRPPARVVYVLLGHDRNIGYTDPFLKALKQYVQQTEGLKRMDVP